MTPAEVIARIMERHPNGVTAKQLVGGLVGPGCMYSQAQQAVIDALDRGDIVIGLGMRLFARKDESYAYA